MPPLFGTWLFETRRLQVEAYKKDPRDLDVAAWLEFVREDTLAAFIELGEFIQELTWKPWAKEKRFPTEEERERAIEEIVDVLHFVGNDLVALGVSDMELTLAYKKKMQKNRDRMANGGH